MTNAASVPKRPLSRRIRSFFFNLPWNTAALIGRALYGFRVQGRENIPEQGPYIVALNEQGIIGMLISGYLSIAILNKELAKNPAGSTSYMQEELWALEYFRRALGPKARGQYRALIPHGAGMLALGLMDGYRTLTKGGIVILNPEGDATWDGLPLPVGHSLAWLALHTAAPILPTLTTIGCYEVWPRWQQKPNGRGRMKVVIGKPITLRTEPMEIVRDSDLREASARLRLEFDKLAYGPDGVQGWVGPTLRHGAPVAGKVDLGPRPAVTPRAASDGRPPVAPNKRGVAQLLWQCPVCQTDEALVHTHRRFRADTVVCRACATRWELESQPGRDFRLKVIGGPEHLVGLDMPLSVWYAQMKQHAVFHELVGNGSKQPEESPLCATELLPDEVLHLVKDEVPLLPYRPNALFDGHVGRQPPTEQLLGKHEYADWESIGEGRLMMTSQRLWWQGQGRELDFLWSNVTAVYLFLSDVLAIRYGTAKYRFKLSNELALKWLTYAAEMVQKQAALDGHEVTITQF